MGLLSTTEVVDGASALSASTLGRAAAILVSAGAVLWFIMRNMIKYQKYFTDFYIAENVKLRDNQEKMQVQINELREALNAKDTEILQLKNDLRDQIATKDREIWTLTYKNQVLQNKSDTQQVEIEALKEKMKNAGLS